MLDGRVLIADSAEEIILAIPNHNHVVDPVAIPELLHFICLFGNLTQVGRIPYQETLNSTRILGR
jgi:hypothetical protein